MGWMCLATWTMASSVAVIVLGGCAATSAPTADVVPTPMPAPALPAGWTVTSSDDGRVSLAVPPDLVAIVLPRGVLAQAPMADGITPIEVSAIGPAGAQDQPRGGEPLRAWLEAGFWVPKPGEGGITEIGDEDVREEWLPAGHVLRIALTAEPGTPAASRVIVYAIGTDQGFAVLRIVGQPDEIERRKDELALVAALVEFSAP